MDGASRRGRMCWIASVCCCTAENCWAKPSTVSPNSPSWEMGASRKRALSTSFISARLSQRCSGTATALSTWGMPAYPLATPPSRVVRTEEADERLLAVKGAIHELVSSSCTSGKKGTGAGRGCEPRPAPRNQSSSREGSGLGGLLTSSPMLTAARASMAVSSGSDAAVATTPEGGSPTAPSSTEDVNPSPDAAIDILSTDGAPNEMLGAPWDRPAKSPGNRTGCSLREE